MRLLGIVWFTFVYALSGAAGIFLGYHLMGDGPGFFLRSDPAQLLVVDVQKIRQEGDEPLYRPTFALADAPPPRVEYVGQVWLKGSPPRQGEILPGRYDPTTGEMRSRVRIGMTLWLGLLLQLLGAALLIEAVMIAHGFPVRELPLRLSGRRRGPMRLLDIVDDL